MTDYANIPQLNIPMVDPNSGVLTTPWIRFFLALMNRTGGSVPDTPTDSALQAMMTDTSDQGRAITKQTDRSLLWAMPPMEAAPDARLVILAQMLAETPEGDCSRSYAPESVTIGTSPFTYQAASIGMTLVSGGGVSAMEFSRDGTNFYPTGSFYGAFPLRKADRLRITYTDAPTVTFIPI